MTYLQARLFRQTGVCPSSPAIGHFPSAPRVAAEPVDRMAHVASPAPAVASDFNGLSIEDCKSLSQFAHMHPLHRADSVAKVFNRASAIKDIAVKEGAAKFQTHYFS